MINRPPTPLPIGAEWLNAMPQGQDWTPPANPPQPVREVHFRNVTGRASGKPTKVVEWLYASVGAANLSRGTATNKAVRDWVQKEVGNANDDAGHIIGSNQGGLGTVEWNIFPQNSNFNRGVFASDVERMINDAARRGPVRIWFRFMYDDPDRPGRPNDFRYFIDAPNAFQCNDGLVNPYKGKGGDVPGKLIVAGKQIHP